MDNAWLSVERLASFVASVCETTWFFKNAWRPLRRLCVRPRVFWGCFVKEIATTRLETVFCLGEEYEIKMKNEEKFKGRMFLHFFTYCLGKFLKR